MAPQNWRRWCWAFVVFLLALPSPPAADAANVTNEDIRDAIVSLVHLFRQSEDQLSRHEFREKALGDQLKKILIGLDKKVRPLEPLKGMISRLDERLSNVETILLQKEEREKGNHKKTSDALEAIQKSLQEIRKGDAASQLEVKLDAVKQDVDSLKSSLSKESLRAACVGSESSPLEKHLSEAEKLLNKYEVKLSEYNGSRVQTDIVPLSDVTMQDDACKITEAIERQEKEIKKVQQILSDSETSLKDLPSKEDLRSAHNETLASLQAVAEAARQRDEKVVHELTTKLRDLGDRLGATNEDIQRSLTQSNTMNEQATADILKNCDALRSELKLLSKNDNVLIQTADNVLATKKRVEYGVHQILLEVGELVRAQGQSVNRTIGDRFDAIEATLVAAQSLAISNMSSRVESEMSQVWRQIGIMHTQLTAAKLVLDNVNNQTEQYVNGSGNSLDKIKDKVSGIKFRMGEVDESLQYLLGRLSLVTQEFNRVKDGLGEALRQAHISLKQVRDKLPVAPSGPGPHEIPKVDVRSENEA